MSYIYPTYSGPAGALVKDPTPIIEVNGQRLRITKVHPTEGITFDRLGAEPPEGQPETVIERACGMVGGTFADLAAVAAHLANPPAPVVVLRQTTRVVIDRLTIAEKTALRACTIPQIIDAYDVAVSEGAISEADPQFAEFTNALHTLGIILKPRWQELLAP